MYAAGKRKFTAMATVKTFEHAYELINHLKKEAWVNSKTLHWSIFLNQKVGVSNIILVIA